MLNFQFKYKDIKPYEPKYKKTNKSDTPILSELHLDGVKKHSTAPKRAIEKLYEFPSAKSQKRGITRYDLRYTTGTMPDFNYKPTDITDVDEMEVLDNFHLPKVDANIKFIGIKPMSFKETQLNNMKEELGIPNPLTALRVEATEGLPINEYKEKTDKIMDDFESFKKSIIANKHIDEDGKRIAINAMERYKKQGIQHPNSKGVFKDPNPEETKQFLDIMDNAGKKLQIEKASNILKQQPKTQSTPSANALSNDEDDEYNSYKKPDSIYSEEGINNRLKVYTQNMNNMNDLTNYLSGYSYLDDMKYIKNALQSLHKTPEDIEAITAFKNKLKSLEFPPNTTYNDEARTEAINTIDNTIRLLSSQPVDRQEIEKRLKEAREPEPEPEKVSKPKRLPSPEKYEGEIPTDVIDSLSDIKNKIVFNDVKEQIKKNDPTITNNRGLHTKAKEIINRQEHPEKYTLKDKKVELTETRKELKTLLNNKIETPQQVGELNNTRKKIIELYNDIHKSNEVYSEGLFETLKNDYNEFVKELESNDSLLDTETLKKVNKYLLLSGQDHIANIKGTTAAIRLKKPIVQSNFRKFEPSNTSKRTVSTQRARIMTFSDLNNNESKEGGQTNTKTKTK